MCSVKSLARKRRKQITANKLGIYVQHSPRSTIDFISHCSISCKPLKNFRNLSVQPEFRGRNYLHIRRKMVKFLFYFQSREQVVDRRGRIRRIRWVIKTLEAQVRHFLLGCKWPVSRGIALQEQYILDEITAAFFLQNVLQVHKQRYVILRTVNLALSKVINEEDAVLIPKN